MTPKEICRVTVYQTPEGIYARTTSDGGTPLNARDLGTLAAAIENAGNEFADAMRGTLPSQFERAAFDEGRQLGRSMRGNECDGMVSFTEEPDPDTNDRAL